MGRMSCKMLRMDGWMRDGCATDDGHDGARGRLCGLAVRSCGCGWHREDAWLWRSAALRDMSSREGGRYRHTMYTRLWGSGRMRPALRGGRIGVRRGACTRTARPNSCVVCLVGTRGARCLGGQKKKKKKKKKKK